MKIKQWRFVTSYQSYADQIKINQYVWPVSLLETTVHEGDGHLHDIQKADTLPMAKPSFHLEGQTSDKQQQVPISAQTPSLNRTYVLSFHLPVVKVKQ